MLAARIVLARLPNLEWIRIADPAVGAADDFQFSAGGANHAVQVKWSQYPGTFKWSQLSGPAPKDSLIRRLAEAWSRMRASRDGPTTVHLRSNEAPSVANPAGNSALGRCRAASPKHFAAFIARSFNLVRDDLRSGATADEVLEMEAYRDWEPAWDGLRGASGLSQEDFLQFVVDFDLVLGPTFEEPLAVDPGRHDQLRHMAATIEALVADPRRPVQLSKQELLDELGWSDLLKFRNPHSFPVPTVYAANQTAQDALLSRRRTLPGGYLALLGPAGSGKSTLLSAMEWLPGDHVARYYAFVPDSPDPLSGRGEASGFLHDVAFAMEDLGIARSGYANDLDNKRLVFFDQLERAGRRWDESGDVTIIVVDGLDHIPREQRPERSLIDELPPPQALPDGVFIVLGSQTADILPNAVSEALRSEHRTVDLPPLSDKEVSQLAKAAGPGQWLNPAQIQSLYASSEGHPLALTYILQDLNALAEREEPEDVRSIEADNILEDAISFGPAVDGRYRGYLQGVASDAGVMSVLGRISRLRNPVDLRWVSTWATPESLQQLQAHASTFFWRSGTTWRFIHNSFRLFLADETAKVGGTPDAARDSSIHSDLAELCANSSSEWPAYQDEELAHRVLAGQHDRVIETATPTALRQKLLDFRPVATVRDQLNLAMRSAAALNDLGSLTRLLFFYAELAQRDMVSDPAAIARLVALADPMLGAEHVVAANQLRVDPSHALAVAAEMARQGLDQQANSILNAAGGLSGIVDNRFGHRRAAEADTFADWAEVRLHLSGIDEVLSELDKVLPPPDGPPPDEPSPGTSDVDWREIRELRDRHASVVFWRNTVHARCLDLSVAGGMDDAVDPLVDRIEDEAPLSWRARVRLVRARQAAVDGDVATLLSECRSLVELGWEQREDEVEGEDAFVADEQTATPAVPLSIRVQAALLLAKADMVDSPEVDRLLPEGTRAEWPTSYAGDEGLSPYRTWFGLQTIAACSGRPSETGNLPGAASAHERDRGTRRFASALSLLAELEGQELRVRLGLQPPFTVVGRCDPLIRLFEVPARQTLDWSYWYSYQGAAAEIYSRLLALAARAGHEELEATFARFTEAWHDPDRGRYWSPKLRSSILAAAAEWCDDAAVEEIATELEQAQRLAVEIAQDSHSRTEACLAIADAWLALDRPEDAFGAAKLAVESASKVGARDGDPQFRHWLDWIEAAHSGGALDQSQYTSALSRFASRLVFAKESDASLSEAAEHLVGLAWKPSPAFSTAMAEHLCNLGVFDEAHAIKSVLNAAIADTRVPLIPTAQTAAEIHIPVDQQWPEAALAAVRKNRSGEEEDEAETLLQEALSIWAIDGSESGLYDGAEDPNGTQETSPCFQTPQDLLEAMRAANPCDANDWEKATGVLSGSVSKAMGKRLIDEAMRLGISDAVGGTIAAAAARSGLTEISQRFFTWCLARTPSQGWLQNWDGGSRLALVRAALADGDPHLAEIAVSDLVGVLTTGRFYGHLSPREVFDIMSAIGGSAAIASIHNSVEQHLDEIAPVGPHIPVIADESSGEAEAATAALVDWITRYLGHPVRPLDFGARRALAMWMPTAPGIVQRALATSVLRGGWPAEAALMTLIFAGTHTGPLVGELKDALADAAVGADEIVRELARRVASAHEIELPSPTGRALHPSYSLHYPELPEHHAPEVDRHGVPYVDYSDPQQVVAPYGLEVSLIARQCGIDEAAALHRAASVAISSDEPWLSGGHRDQADRLRARQQKHSYRPWAYMAGRRALGAVMAEFGDAQLLAASQLIHSIGLIDDVLICVEVEPLNESTPLPWRLQGTSSHDVKGWCSEVDQAAAHYAEVTAASIPFVLAELSEWKSLEWGSPEETRIIETSYGQEQKGLHDPQDKGAWEQYIYGATSYLSLLETMWAEGPMVVRGREHGADARWLEWIALHPGAAASVDWVLQEGVPFAWRGRDGVLRARTVHRARGQLSHQPPAAKSVAAVWQIEITDIGLAELTEALGPLRRTMTVQRKLPARSREGHPNEEQISVSVPID